ncbi:nucleotide-binding protein [Methanosphaerula subterraneus]|uniref:nucleotide-binding protein n=1 Tax=Methanosphaerula subterraneus TaxID=3350244 RepID=UPI003F86711D
MKIGTINVRVSVLVIAVFLTLTFLLLYNWVMTGNTQLLIWGIPTLVLLLIIPMALNYMSQSTYVSMIPMYEEEAKSVKINTINENLNGKAIRIEGVVERCYFKFLNRPQYLIADRTGEISVKMFTSPQENVSKGDVVEVLGQVIRRYVAVGDPVVNAVKIRKLESPELIERYKKKVPSRKR